MAKTYYRDDGEKITHVQKTHGEPPSGEGNWKEGAADMHKFVGDKLEWFDADMKRIPDETLVAQGKRKDDRGRWNHKTNIGSTHLIHGLDEEAGDEWTKEAPLENEPHQIWDVVAKKFVVDIKKKEQAEKETAIAEVRQKIDDAERRMIRPMRAISAGRASQEDRKVFAELDTHIETELRPKLHELEKELLDSA